MSSLALETGNLRQIVLKKLSKQGYRCNCIRCRETGLQRRYPSEDEVILRRLDYSASEGREIFLSYQSKAGDTILGFLVEKRGKTAQGRARWQCSG